MAAERLVETVELFKDRLVNIMAKAKEAAEAAAEAAKAKEAAAEAEEEVVEKKVSDPWEKATNALQHANIEFAKLRADIIGMGEFAKQFDCSKIMTPTYSRTPAQLKRDTEYAFRNLEKQLGREGAEKFKKKYHLTGGTGGLPPANFSKDAKIEYLQAMADKSIEKPADDSGKISELLRNFGPSSTADATDKLFGNSTWLYKKDDKGGEQLKPEGERVANWASNWNDKALLKCIAYGDTNQLCKCIEGIPEGDNYAEEFVKSLSSDELQKLFKLFGVHLQRVDCVLVPPRAKDWKNSFPCSNKSPNVIKFIVDCIELCSDPANYLLLNTQEDVDCYRELKIAQKKKQCETLRTKPPRNETSSPLCPQQVYAPMNAFYQLGGSVNYVNQNSTIGKFLMSGGRITKQSGGVTDNACCANMLEASLNAVVNQLKSQGKRISDSDLSHLKSDIALIGKIEASLRTLIEKKLKIYSYSLGSRNCRPGDEAEVLELADIAGDDNAMGEKLKADYELCSKQIQGSCDQYNQLVSSFTNGLNVLQLQPVGFGF
uniref:Uncharacterized protein n=1 Tax=viral metagenome TaxID=1070528 RepID=A0A6C0DZZ1_9ZZZZ